MANVHEPSEEDDRQRRAVVFDKLSYVPLKEVTSTNDTAGKGGHQDQKGHHDCEIGRGIPGNTPLTGQHLNALLQVDEGNVKAKNITGESSDVSQGIAGVGNGEDPVHHKRPPINSP